MYTTASSQQSSPELTTPPTSPEKKYAHLLYVDTKKRIALMATSHSQASSLCSSSSSSSSVSLASDHITNSDASHRSRSPSLQNIRMPKYAGDHYPLILTISPHLIPAHVPKDHSAIICARAMAQMHNTVIRAINSSYNHALTIEPQDAEDFLFFNKQICKMIRHHQPTKDEYLFPAIEELLGKTGDMNSDATEHERSMQSFKVFEAYVDRTKPAEYIGRTFRHLIESFAPRLIQHLHDEITTLTAAWVLDSKQLMKVWKKAKEMANKDTALWAQTCWVLGCQDKSFKLDGEVCGFPDIPSVVQWLVGKFYGKKHKGAWRWCPSDVQGRRRLILL